METIIIMVILAIVSSIFSGNKKDKQKQKPMPPFSQQPSTKTIETPKEERRPRSLEDFAKEVFQQLNEQEKPVEQPDPPKQEKRKQSSVESQATFKREERSKPVVSNRPVFNENRTSNRPSLSKDGQNRDSIKKREIGSVVPTTRDALLQAIITSEIIGPPKAKQRR